MLVFKFNKLGRCKFLPHLDVLRHVVRTIRRAGIEAKYSEGFNPHMLINMSPPLPLGAESEAEYCYVNTDVKPRAFKKLYNEFAIKGMEATECYGVQKNPNIAGLSHSACYEIFINGLENHFDEIFEMMNEKKFYIEFYQKGENVVKDVFSQIVKLGAEGDKLYATLKCGNDNLRVDRFSYNLAKKFDLDSRSVRFKKISHNILQSGKIIDVTKAVD